MLWYGHYTFTGLWVELVQTIYGNHTMRVEYDKETDSLTITLRNSRIKESDEVRPGVIADFGYDGGIVRFEVLEASLVVEQTREMQFAIA
ncbi:MAG: DUF2283 domain-containing protein [Thermoguttaceae bacterium]